MEFVSVINSIFLVLEKNSLTITVMQEPFNPSADRVTLDRLEVFNIATTINLTNTIEGRLSRSKLSNSGTLTESPLPKTTKTSTNYKLVLFILGICFAWAVFGCVSHFITRPIYENFGSNTVV